MRRCLFNLLAALSLLIASAFGGLWVRSIGKDLSLHHWVRNGEHKDLVSSSNGMLFYSHSFADYPDPSHWFWRIADSPPDDKIPSVIEDGRHFGGSGYYLGPDRFAIQIPHFLIVLLTAAPAAARVIYHCRHSRRQRTGHCRQCGYDLQGLPGPRLRCPECGTEVVASCE